MTAQPEPADSSAALRACYPVIRELRPHLTEEAFVAQAQRQRERHGYRLVYLEDEGKVVAAAGYRIAEFLAWGKALYIDDLATLSTARKRGHAGRLLDWLIAQARAEGCDQLHLDSGVQRHDAHRLYLGRRLRITSHHFAIELG